ncbi:MAG TPA: nickel pincer cofactor biosynthesis protein LarB [Burkholderiales bacterium]|nr:nickel pincer cofactor biosynthesis protein LarB [Burkholderiales bacterium]
MTLHKDVMLDFARDARTGLEEAVLCASKSVAHLSVILDQVQAKGRHMLLTRLLPEQYAALTDTHRAAIDYDPISRTGFFGGSHELRTDTRIAVVAAGTSDIAVSREAARTLQFYGEPVAEISDVGVAGLWRLLERIEEIRKMKIVIAVAGMDAALPTVIGGLVAGPIIGVPTSVGYGVATGGQTALNAMLASCSSGLTVTNIDNGFGAACAALRILRSH